MYGNNCNSMSLLKSSSDCPGVAQHPTRKPNIYLDIYAGDHCPPTTRPLPSSIMTNDDHPHMDDDALSTPLLQQKRLPFEQTLCYSKSDIAHDGCTVLCQAQHCLQMGIHRCAACELASYCSEKCRLQDRPRHEVFCRQHVTKHRIQVMQEFHFQKQQQTQKPNAETALYPAAATAAAGSDDRSTSMTSTSSSSSSSSSSDGVLGCRGLPSCRVNTMVSFCPHCVAPVCGQYDCAKFHLDHCRAFETFKAALDQEWVLVENPNAWVMIERVRVRQRRSFSLQQQQQQRQEKCVDSPRIVRILVPSGCPPQSKYHHNQSL